MLGKTHLFKVTQPRKLTLGSICLLGVSLFLIFGARIIVSKLALAVVLSAPQLLVYTPVFSILGYALMGVGLAGFLYFGLRSRFTVDGQKVRVQSYKLRFLIIGATCFLAMSSFFTSIPIISADAMATSGYYLATPLPIADWYLGNYTNGNIFAISGSNWANMMTYPTPAPWAADTGNYVKVWQDVLGSISFGTIYAKEVAFPLSLMSSIPAKTQVICNYQGDIYTYTNPSNSQGSPYTVSVGQGINAGYYMAADAGNRIVFTSTNASYVFNSVTYNMNSQHKGGLISVEAGEYNITTSILSYGGIKLQGEGLNKYLNQSGTKLQLSGGNFPLIIVNGTNAIGNQYFASVADMELYGNGYQSYTFSAGKVMTNCSAGVMFTGQSSDYLLENLFIHGVGVCVYGDEGSWYGRVSKCWLEGSGIGLYVEHKQMILAESNLSGLTYGIYCTNLARDVLVSTCHIYSILYSGVYIQQRTAGTYGYNFDTCDFTDCATSSFTMYAYTGVNLNVTITNCNFGFQDSRTQQYGISTWTGGTGQISFQVGFSRFYSVTSEPLHVLSGSTNATFWTLGYNTGNVTNTAP